MIFPDLMIHRVYSRVYVHTSSSSPLCSRRLVVHFMHVKGGTDMKSCITDRDSLMRLWTNEKETSGLKKREIGRSSDCSRLINARVSLTSARQKSSAARSPNWKSPASAWRRVGAWKQFLARRILSLLLLSNDLPGSEREERRSACVNLLERFLAISESRTFATRRRAAPGSKRLHITCGRVLCRLLNMIMRFVDAKCYVLLVEKSQLSIIPFMQ